MGFFIPYIYLFFHCGSLFLFLFFQFDFKCYKMFISLVFSHIFITEQIEDADIMQTVPIWCTCECLMPLVAWQHDLPNSSIMEMCLDITLVKVL